MKQLSIRILENSIEFDPREFTIPEIIRICSGLVYNISGVEPDAKLHIDEDGNMSIVADDDNFDGPDSATIDINIENGFFAGGLVQLNKQSKSTVLRAINYLYHIYAKRLIQIAQELLGRESEHIETWTERVINKNQI